MISRISYFKSTNQRLMANGNSGAGRNKVQGKERRVSPLHTGIEANGNSGAGRKKVQGKERRVSPLYTGIEANSDFYCFSCILV